MSNEGNNKLNINKEVKIETCYLCGIEFDINADDLSHYHYGKYPMCTYCSEAYGFFNQE
ncbi:hypothetical protein [Methanobrevibacter curvatus]|uniref:C2H2-type domain-containing protein n=1 Tax=Methanobrevibacter curvatus TaxID=49547 RepID=A0A162FI86_9EURY|nr:hypothetical protein [Methanobrevibacter curvatus]KZX13435.1 hypothetical protein MBCUR_06990 [Methanobrevibacter curvatus]